MKSLTYLFFTTMKNSLLELKHNPGKLIFTILMIALIGFTMWSGNMGSAHAETVRPMNELLAMAFVLFLGVFGFGCAAGLQSGASFYSLADVALVFHAPISQKKVLIYGLVKQLGSSIMVALFLLFQYGWLSTTYGISLPFFLAVLVAYIFTFFCGQLTAMVIYCFSSGNEMKRKFIKLMLIGIFAVILVPPLFAAITAVDRLSAVVAILTSGGYGFVPVAGFMLTALSGLAAGKYIALVFGLVMAVLYMALLILILLQMRTDFYEDVLVATERTASAITNKREGKVQDVLPSQIKTGKTGIAGGLGASVFFWKHQLESRRARVLLFDGMTLIFAAVSIGFSWFMREGGLLAGFAFATYMQLFGVSSGRWVRELLLPYVYLIPESSFKKLMWTLADSAWRLLPEAMLVMIPIGLICKEGVEIIILAVFARAAFGALFIAGNLLCERLLGSVQSKTLMIMFYFFMMIAVAIPGLVLAIILASLSGGSIAVALGVLSLWNILLAVVLTYLCRDVLENAELNNR